MISFDIRLDSLYNDNFTATGSTAELDLENRIGNVFLNVSARAGGTGNTTVTVEHSEVSGSGFSAVPASALFNVLTGAVGTFTNITTTALDETLGLNRQQLKRFVRVTFAGTITSQDVAVTAGTQPQATSDS